MGAYAEALPVFREHGIQVYPTRSEAPTISKVLSPGRFRAFTVDHRFADANAAFIAGNDNNITIVDIDAEGSYYPDMIAEMCGETPYIVKTPSGGTHMGYRHNGERRSIRAFGKNIPVDLLGGGTVVAPPSTRPAKGAKCAGEYRFNGDLSGALAALPTIRELPPELYRDSGTTREPQCSPAVGERNETLFRIVRSLAAKSVSKSSLVEALLRENERLAEPLLVDEVQRIAGSAWKYKTEGRLLLPGSRTGFLSLQEITILSAHPSAAILLAYLRAHRSTKHIFAVSPHGIADSGRLQLDHRTIRSARDFLLENRFIEPAPNRQHQFRLS